MLGSIFYISGVGYCREEGVVYAYFCIMKPLFGVGYCVVCELMEWGSG